MSDLITVTLQPTPKDLLDPEIFTSDDFNRAIQKANPEKNCRSTLFIVSTPISEQERIYRKVLFSGIKAKLIKITIPDSVTSIDNLAFAGCENLTKILIPPSVTSIDNLAFAGCENLTKILIPPSVTSIGLAAFYKCKQLTTLTLPDNLTEIPESAFDGCENLTEILIPPSVTSIGHWAFSDCKNLAFLTLPDNLTEIPKRAFNGCENLTEILIPPSVISIGKAAFADCKNLAFLTLPDNLTEIPELAFDGCENLTKTLISPSVTSIGLAAFYKCKQLTTLTLPDNLTEIPESAFDGCENLTEILIPPSVTSIGHWAFSDCKNLAFLTLPDNLTEIPKRAFNGCENLTEILIPPSVTSIGEWAFSCCKNLAFLTLPDNLTEIPELAFYGCENLTEILIPPSVTSIGEWAFSCCSNLKQLTFPYTCTFTPAFRFFEQVSSMEINVSNCMGAPNAQMTTKFPFLLKCQKVSQHIQLQLLGGNTYPFTYTDKDGHFFLRERTQKDQDSPLIEPVWVDMNKQGNPYDDLSKALQEQMLNGFLQDEDGFQLIANNENQDYLLLRMAHGNTLDDSNNFFQFSNDSLEKNPQLPQIDWPTCNLNDQSKVAIEAAKNHQPTLFFARELSLHLITGKFSGKTAENAEEKGRQPISRNKELKQLKSLLKLNILDQAFIDALYSFNPPYTLLKNYFKANGASLENNAWPKSFWEVIHAFRRWVKVLLGYKFESQCLAALRMLNNNDHLSMSNVKETHIQVLKSYYGTDTASNDASPKTNTDNSALLQKKLRGSTFARLYKAQTGEDYNITNTQNEANQTASKKT